MGGGGGEIYRIYRVSQVVYVFDVGYGGSVVDVDVLLTACKKRGHRSRFVGEGRYKKSKIEPLLQN